MTTSELSVIANSLEWISEITGTAIDVVVHALVGVCFSEEEAGEILEWFLD